MGILENKTALITGAGSGLGEAIAGKFVEEGAKVILADVSGQEKTVAETLGTNAQNIHLDVSDSNSVANLEKWLNDENIKIDILANNAGINGPNLPTHQYPLEEYDRVQNVNTRGMYMMMQLGLRNMLKHGGGAIVNTASIGGLYATPNASAYISGKGAVIMMTKTAALEYATDNIRVNAIAPGIISTPWIDQLDPQLVEFLAKQIPQGRIGTPGEVANVAAFLASDQASHVTGQAWVIDGGRSAG